MDVKGLPLCVELRGMLMKSRIAFMFVLAALLNPISVMAEGLTSKISDEAKSTSVGCNLWAKKVLDERSAATSTASGPRSKSKTAGDAT